MNNIDSIYKCEICGNVVSVIETGNGTLICCNEEMVKLKEKTLKDEGKEKHVPIVEIKGKNVLVKIGSIPHPMTEEHWIELVQIMKGDNVIMQRRLFPGEQPEVEFCINDTNGIKARILCNVHGLWIN
ncbi:desulfoferrodoxin FeS4 iron-binding domain-containing protein [Candidatus Woesearchaeota archaeon]|nr:desulfoferrodoxin FeS4 iron-binding domain-containing protein [Candidatus Woesearchaeota archaeon]